MPPKVMEMRLTVSMKACGLSRVDFDVENVDTGEALEQYALTFHDWLGSQMGRGYPGRESRCHRK